MKSLSSVGLGLSVVFGCLLLALVAELYYLLWWKKRFTSREIGESYSSPARDFLYMFCWKKPSSLNPQETHVHEPQSLHISSNNNNKTHFLLKSFGSEEDENDENGIEIIAAGPPRFLFTIAEETKEDLESEDGKNSRKGSRSLSDLLLMSNVENSQNTPYLTPLASPPFFTPPLTPTLDSYNNVHQHGFNPLFESSTDTEFRKMRFSPKSPPPKFKFLQDAEEKLYRKKVKMEELGQKKLKEEEEEEGSFFTIIVDKNNQVLPLASSPSSTLRS